MPEITNEATIRDAAVSGHQRIADIYGYHVLNGLASFEESPSDVAEISRRSNGVRRLNMPYIVAELDGGIVGYAYCSSYRPSPAYRFTVETTVYVDHRFPHRRLDY